MTAEELEGQCENYDHSYPGWPVHTSKKCHFEHGEKAKSTGKLIGDFFRSLFGKTVKNEMIKYCTECKTIVEN